jgi:hypothetical protein
MGKIAISVELKKVPAQAHVRHIATPCPALSIISLFILLMEIGSANSQACICTCGCNQYVSYLTRRAHVAAKRAAATEGPGAIDWLQPLRETNVVAGRKRWHSSELPGDHSCYDLKGKLRLQ